jgi:acyl-CoA synthetase (AMP-forming)/AMP-acid ligase II
MHWFGSFIVGGKGIILRGVSPKWIIQTISEEKCTICWLLVPWAQDILDAIDSGLLELEDYNLDQWRLMHIGAQPVPPSLIKRWKAIFPNHEYDTNYGLTESLGPGCVHLGIENIHKHESELKKYAISKLENNDHIIIYNKDADVGIITFNIKDVFAQDEATLLNSKGIAVRSGQHCAKVLNDYLKTPATCRASFYLYTTKEEVDVFIDALINGGDFLDAFFS